MTTIDQEKDIIAVAMLTYNRAKGAVTSIRSVCDDPLVSKVWVLDDGSDKENWRILKEFCEGQPKVKLIRNKKNLGYAANLIKALNLLREEKNDYVFLCESDMLLAKGWGSVVINTFRLSPETIGIAPMLHTDQLAPNRSEYFIERCLKGIYIKQKDGSLKQVKKPFGSCFTELPDRQKPLTAGRFKIRYVSNSIGTLIFRKEFFKKLPFNDIREYPVEEDGWLSWACFEYNNYNPKSLAVLDPGLAFTYGEGLHGAMILTNQRWIGSFWWRYSTTSFITRTLLKIYKRLGRSFFPATR
jgi:glycosyltransferase involved in cell wall biosynthesis